MAKALDGTLRIIGSDARGTTFGVYDRAVLLGYTPEEIAAFFPGRFDALAKKHKTNR